MVEHYIGLISGTSMDGVDAVLVAFGDHTVEIVGSTTVPYPPELASTLRDLVSNPDQCSLDLIGMLHNRIGHCFADAATALLAADEKLSENVTAIGSHGQTIRHCPDAEHPFTLQIGDPSVIAARTGIDTVADFRPADLAQGGQAAPLVPPFHQWLFADVGQTSCIVNIGGIANLTVLDGDIVTGFDTGPGNGLMDLQAIRHLDTPYDEAGRWAASGQVDADLLAAMREDPYFDLAPPKSTGFEHFNAQWLSAFSGARPVDLQATLCALTAATIGDAIRQHATETDLVLVCGGGAHNDELMRMLSESLPGCRVVSTESHGLHPDWVEACAFAWLARETLAGRPGNLPSVTGASQPAILGGIYKALR